MNAYDLEPSCYLITDVRMTGMDGWELQRMAVQKFPKLPVVFILTRGSRGLAVFRKTEQGVAPRGHRDEEISPL